MTGRPRSRLWTWIIHMTSCWTGCFDSALICREKKIKDARTQTPARAISLPPDRKDFQTEAEYAQAYLAWDVVSRAEKTRTQTSEFNLATEGVPSQGTEDVKTNGCCNKCGCFAGVCGRTKEGCCWGFCCKQKPDLDKINTITPSAPPAYVTLDARPGEGIPASMKDAEIVAGLDDRAGDGRPVSASENKLPGDPSTGQTGTGGEGTSHAHDQRRDDQTAAALGTPRPEHAQGIDELSPFTPEGAMNPQDAAAVREQVADCIRTRKVRYKRNANQILTGERAINEQVRVIQNHTITDGKLRVAMFDISNRKILNALNDALDRGVEIWCIVDKAQYEIAKTKHRNKLSPLLPYENFRAFPCSGNLRIAIGVDST